MGWFYFVWNFALHLSIAMSSSSGSDVECLGEREFDPSDSSNGSNSLYVPVHCTDEKYERMHKFMASQIKQQAAENSRLITKLNAMKRGLDETAMSAEDENKHLRAENKRLRAAVRGALKNQTAYARTLVDVRGRPSSCPEAEGL